MSPLLPSGNADQPIDAGQHVHSLLSRIGEIPSALRDKATSFIAIKYEQLSERYGSTGAKAILAGAVILTPVPLPGTSLLPIALAEGIKQISGLASDSGKHMAEAVGTVGSEMRSRLESLARQVGVSFEDLEKAARELLQEAMGIDPIV